MKDRQQVGVAARAQRRAVLALFAGMAVVGAAGMTLLGGYGSDFEALNASSSGVILTGQDGYYIPSGTNSVDYLAFTYGGNESVCPTTSTWVNASTTNGAGNECGSDDAYYSARRATFAPALGLLLRNDMMFTVSNTSPSELTISVEASIDNAGVTNVTGRLRVKNQVSGSFVVLANGPLTATDSVLSGTRTTDAADFIGANGEVECDFTFTQTSGGPNWNGRIDDATASIPGTNAFGIPQNPLGSDQFVAGMGPASPTFARAQRDITWPTGVVEVSYDVCAAFLGTLPTANNVGSFSVQPFPGSADYIHLASWVDVNTGDRWRMFYLMYNAGGTQDAQPGQSPGPEWDNLLLNNWYRFTTKIDFTQNRIIEVSVTDLTGGGATTTVDVSGLEYYLEGGAAGGFPHPTGFRFFAGGGVAGNVLAFDNININ